MGLANAKVILILILIHPGNPCLKSVEIDALWRIWI